MTLWGRAWKWIREQLSGQQTLHGKAAATGATTAAEARKTPKHGGQLEASRREVMKKGHFARALGQWHLSLLCWLGAWETLPLQQASVEALGSLAAWAAKAKNAAQAISRTREAVFKEKLADKFPGSSGLLHRVCHWRAAWVPTRGSVDKKLLEVDPQAAAQSEADSWKQVWPPGQRHVWKQERPADEQGHERQSNGEEQLPALDPPMVRRICAAIV